MNCLQNTSHLSAISPKPALRSQPCLIAGVAIGIITLLAGLFLGLHAGGSLTFAFLPPLNAIPPSIVMSVGLVILSSSALPPLLQAKENVPPSPPAKSPSSAFITPQQTEKRAIVYGQLDFFSPPPGTPRPKITDISRFKQLLPLYKSLQKFQLEETAKATLEKMNEKWWINIPQDLQPPDPVVINKTDLKTVTQLIDLFLREDFMNIPLRELQILAAPQDDALLIFLQNLVLMRGCGQTPPLFPASHTIGSFLQNPLEERDHVPSTLAVWISEMQLIEILDTLPQHWAIELFPTVSCFKTWNFRRMLAVRDQDPSCKLLKKLEAFVPKTCRIEFDALMNPDKPALEQYLSSIDTPSTHGLKSKQT